MKELTTEVVKIEVTGYEAFDGKFFRSKEECKKYEESAASVCAKEIAQYKIGEGSQYGLFDWAMDDNNVEIYDVKDADVLHKLNMYLATKEQCGSSDFISDKYIGKKVMILWNYDHDWCSWATLDDLIEYMKNGYETMLKKMETK